MRSRTLQSFTLAAFALCVALLITLEACHTAVPPVSTTNPGAHIPDTLRSMVRPDSLCMTMTPLGGRERKNTLRHHSCSYSQHDTMFALQYDKAATLIRVSRRILVKPSEADASVRALIASIDAVRQSGYDCPNGPREFSEIKRIWPAPPDVLVLSVEEPLYMVKLPGFTRVELTGIRLIDMLEVPKC